MPSIKKKAARIRGGQQRQAAKQSVVAGEPIPLSEKDKAILLAARQAIAQCLGRTWDVTAAMAGNDRRKFAQSCVALRESLRRAGRVARSLSSVSVLRGKEGER